MTVRDWRYEGAEQAIGISGKGTHSSWPLDDGGRSVDEKKWEIRRTNVNPAFYPLQLSSSPRAGPIGTIRHGSVPWPPTASSASSSPVLLALRRCCRLQRRAEPRFRLGTSPVVGAHDHPRRLPAVTAPPTRSRCMSRSPSVPVSLQHPPDHTRQTFFTTPLGELIVYSVLSPVMDPPVGPVSSTPLSTVSPFSRRLEGSTTVRRLSLSPLRAPFWRLFRKCPTSTASRRLSTLK